MKFENYETWQNTVSQRVKREPMWQFAGYRKGLFLYDLTWQDCDKLGQDFRGKAVANQLIRSVGSITANLDEGYGRGTGKQRQQFYRIALGSARESKGWYWKSHYLLAETVVEHRLALLDEIIALLIDELNRQKRFK
ncbi:four helix bundle protein [Anaerolineales bacterium HSG6]|nr:four helix bundle protein [Anaerolineales bacterium HSG6]